VSTTLLRFALPSWRRHRSEIIAAAVIALAWVSLAARAPGMHASSATEAWWPGLGYCAAMAIAMMGPVALPAIRHVGVNTLAWRRGRAMLEFSVAYLAIWVAFEALVPLITRAIPRAREWSAFVIALIAASAWQLTPLKRMALRACHRSIPLPPTGARAELASIQFGLRNGLACLGTCWCLMLVVATAPSAHVSLSAAIAAVVACERLAERPMHATRVIAASLFALAMVTAITLAMLL
jgi:predicted metal-binding membrane protein